MDKLIRFIKKAVRQQFPSIAIACRYFKVTRDIRNDPMETPMGFKFIGNSSMENGTFEPDETIIVKKILKKADVFINVGANIGYYCCFALECGKHVVAFEPIGTNLLYLYKNMLANHWENTIEIFPIALSNKIGLVKIYGSGATASLIKGWADTPERCTEMVPTSTLDNVLGNRFHGKTCFILVDIEGSEKLMLEGASSFLYSDPKPIWMVEISITEHQPKGLTINPQLMQTFQIFWEAGYEAWTANKLPRLVKPEEVENIVKSGKDTLSTHNFLFFEKGKKKVILDIQ